MPLIPDSVRISPKGREDILPDVFCLRDTFRTENAVRNAVSQSVMYAAAGSPPVILIPFMEALLPWSLL